MSSIKKYKIFEIFPFFWICSLSFANPINLTIFQNQLQYNKIQTAIQICKTHNEDCPKSLSFRIYEYEDPQSNAIIYNIKKIQDIRSTIVCSSLTKQCFIELKLLRSKGEESTKAREILNNLNNLDSAFQHATNNPLNCKDDCAYKKYLRSFSSEMHEKNIYTCPYGKSLTLITKKGANYSGSTEHFIGHGGRENNARCTISFQDINSVSLHSSTHQKDMEWTLKEGYSGNQSTKLTFKATQNYLINELTIECSPGSNKYPMSLNRIEPALSHFGIDLSCKEIKTDNTQQAATRDEGGLT